MGFNFVNDPVMAMADIDLGISSAPIPQSNLRGSAHDQHSAHSNTLDDHTTHSHHSFSSAVDSLNYSSFNGQPHQQLQSNTNGGGALSGQSNGFTASPFQANAFHNDFFSHMGNGETLQELQFSSMMDGNSFDANFEPLPPCDDCSSTNPATVPHHHHKTGRLAGAAPQLDGHYCCRWLIHDQPCLSCFSSAEDLDNHIKSDHAGKDGTYRCLWQDCQKIDKLTNTIQPVNFGNKPKLMRHVHSHTGFKPFPCPYPDCDKGFVTKEQLRNHETTHTKTRKYTCDQCGKAFAVKSALTTHVTAVHEARKIHKCDMCGKAFADSSNLSKHKQTHYKSNGVVKRRSGTNNSSSSGPKRENSDDNSTRTSPSIATPTQPSVTPAALMMNSEAHAKSLPFLSPQAGMLPPMHMPPPLGTATSTAASSSFDPDCFCCEQNCPQPPTDFCCDHDEANCPQPPTDFCCDQENCAEVVSPGKTHQQGLVVMGPHGTPEICCDNQECAPPQMTTHNGIIIPESNNLHHPDCFPAMAQVGAAAHVTAGGGEYCCTAPCQPPAGTPTPCTNKAPTSTTNGNPGGGPGSGGGGCDRSTICDLPGCLSEGGVGGGGYLKKPSLDGAIDCHANANHGGQHQDHDCGSHAENCFLSAAQVDALRSATQMLPGPVNCAGTGGGCSWDVFMAEAARADEAEAGVASSSSTATAASTPRLEAASKRGTSKDQGKAPSGRVRKKTAAASGGKASPDGFTATFPAAVAAPSNGN